MPLEWAVDQLFLKETSQGLRQAYGLHVSMQHCKRSQKIEPNRTRHMGCELFAFIYHSLLIGFEDGP